jgi:hypothetical protein
MWKGFRSRRIGSNHERATVRQRGCKCQAALQAIRAELGCGAATAVPGRAWTSAPKKTAEIGNFYMTFG